MDRMQSVKPTPCHVASLSCVDMLDLMHSVCGCPWEAATRYARERGHDESDAVHIRMAISSLHTAFE